MKERRPHFVTDASLRNRDPILAVLQAQLCRPMTVLEIGSGTGGHAVYFAQRLPHLTWQASDRPRLVEQLGRAVQQAALPNLPPPVALDVTTEPWPITLADAVFSANTAHIMHWPAVEAMFTGVARLLRTGGRFVLYGPFTRDGHYSGENDALFDASLRSQDAGSGLRDLAELESLASPLGLHLAELVPMPANNLTLIWQKRDAPDSGSDAA